MRWFLSQKVFRSWATQDYPWPAVPDWPGCQNADARWSSWQLEKTSMPDSLSLAFRYLLMIFQHHIARTPLFWNIGQHSVSKESTDQRMSLPVIELVWFGLHITLIYRARMYAYVPRSIGNGIDCLYIKVRGSNCLPIYSNNISFVNIPEDFILPRYESQCSTVQEQQCSTVNEQKCTTVQVRLQALFVNVIVLDFFVHGHCRERI